MDLSALPDTPSLDIHCWSLYFSQSGAQKWTQGSRWWGKTALRRVSTIISFIWAQSLLMQFQSLHCGELVGYSSYNHGLWSQKV